MISVQMFFSTSLSSSILCLGRLNELQCQVVAEPILFLYANRHRYALSSSSWSHFSHTATVISYVY